MRIKLKDIAEAAGVSSTTCSLILNNKPINVSAETKQKVINTAQEMGYNYKQKIHNFGLIVPDLENLYYTELIKNISHTVQKWGYNLVILDSNNSTDQELRNLQQFYQAKVDGILISLISDRTDLFPLISLVRKITASKIPIVLLDYSISALGCHSVSMDDYYGGYMATKHLIDLGHRKIGCIRRNMDNPLVPPNRTSGFRAALSEAKIPYSKDLMIDGKFTVECGYHSAPLLLERGATAIFAHNDMIALGVYHYLREHHIRIPEDVSLVGFDGVPIISSLELPLTTVVQPIPSIAERSIDILMDSLQNPTADRIAITLQPELVIRSTTGPVRSL